jgi:sulfur-carrier protein adenylyltransferase/sulfurtransferase
MQQEFLRYSCQMVLPGFSETTQQQLQNAKVLIVGAGGLGCPAGQYLTASGVGTIGVADFDVVSISNLHRQILYTPEEVGLKKVEIACKKLQQQNPSIKLIPLDVKITSKNVLEILDEYDIVLDGTDNFDTRYLLNDACVLTDKPLVYGAIYQYEGQVSVWNVSKADGTRTPNYRDLFPEVNSTQIPNCAEGGVIPTLAGIIGCMQANEVIKYITKTGELLAGKVLIFDAQSMQSRVIKIGAVTKTTITALQETVNSQSISKADLQQAIVNGTFELIDVRTPEERASFDIGGRNIPLNNLQNNTIDLSFDKPIVFYCASGKRSAEAAKMIKKQHPEAEVMSLEGGLKLWLEQP